MKRIIIKEIHLLNFKGIRHADIAFDERMTEISGTNGVGKSTVFDAFCWTLFGKNASDRKDFAIKTTDPDGRPIPMLPHEVTVCLSVSGEPVTLRRCYSEKWAKKRGEGSVRFTGHTEERFFNDVPCGAAEYDAKVKGICSEEVFKFVTNPNYFPTRKEDQMRQLLFEMAGTVDDAEVASGNEDFARLLDQLSGKTMDEYRREIRAKKNNVQAGIETIPSRIDERKRDLAEPEDVSQKEELLAGLKKELDEVSEQISDMGKAYRAAGDRRMATLSRIQELKEQRMRRESDIRAVVQGDYRRALGEKRKLEAELSEVKLHLSRAKLAVEEQRTVLDRYNKEREELLEEWKRISAEIKAGMVPSSMMDESQFVCPACGRRYEMDEIEARQKEITERYLDGKLREKEQNQAKGLALKAKIRSAQEDMTRKETVLGKYASQVADLQSNPILTEELVEPDATEAIATDEAMIVINEEIARREKDADEPFTAPGTDALEARRKQLQLRIEEAQEFIFRQDRVKENNKNNGERIAELEKELRAMNEEKARLEGIEFTMQEFSKARARAIEDKVNAMFSLVRFKLFDTQVNEAEVECCVPMVNGVPYPDANTAGKLNAGLDIINAIVAKKEISAPIFIDGAESIRGMQSTDSQLVLLSVTDEERLTVRHNGVVVENTEKDN
jgi:uncharacterized protein YoxC